MSRPWDDFWVRHGGVDWWTPRRDPILEGGIRQEAQVNTTPSEFIWSVADLLRGDYKQADYGKVILPFTLLRRLDCVPKDTKNAVLKEIAPRKDMAEAAREHFLLKAAGQSFYNTSRYDVPALVGDP
jgi:type I restriction-modification system DNA methylase subunit